MRLSKKEIDSIKNIISLYCPDAKIYLFGSRLDDSKRGGDIDLFIISSKNDYNTKLLIASQIERAISKPIDIVMHRDFNRKIEQEALRGVEL